MPDIRIDVYNTVGLVRGGGYGGSATPLDQRNLWISAFQGNVRPLWMLSPPPVKKKVFAPNS